MARTLGARGRRSRAPGRDRERGAATAELAVLLPALALVTVLAMWSVAVVVAQVRCVDAAGTGARALARGENPAVVREVVADVAPAGARLSFSRSRGLAIVQVRARVGLPGPWAGGGPGVTVADRAVAVTEDGVLQPGGAQ